MPCSHLIFPSFAPLPPPSSATLCFENEQHNGQKQESQGKQNSCFPGFLVLAHSVSKYRGQNKGSASIATGWGRESKKRKRNESCFHFLIGKRVTPSSSPSLLLNRWEVYTSLCQRSISDGGHTFCSSLVSLSP